MKEFFDAAKDPSENDAQASAELTPEQLEVCFILFQNLSQPLKHCRGECCI